MGGRETGCELRGQEGKGERGWRERGRGGEQG